MVLHPFYGKMDWKNKNHGIRLITKRCFIFLWLAIYKTTRTRNRSPTPDDSAVRCRPTAPPFSPGHQPGQDCSGAKQLIEKRFVSRRKCGPPNSYGQFLMTVAEATVQIVR